MENWADLAQLGFAAVMALMLLATIRELIPRLLIVIEQNATTMERMSRAVETNTAALDRLVTGMSDVEGRLIRLEEQHSRNGRMEVRS